MMASSAALHTVAACVDSKPPSWCYERVANKRVAYCDSDPSGAARRCCATCAKWNQTRHSARADRPLPTRLADTISQTMLNEAQLVAGTVAGRVGELCRPSDNVSLLAMTLGGSVSAGLRYSVRQDPHNTLFHAQVAERLSSRLAGRTEMWNGAIPAMGPWIANACTKVIPPNVTYAHDPLQHSLTT